MLDNNIGLNGMIALLLITIMVNEKQKRNIMVRVQEIYPGLIMHGMSLMITEMIPIL